MKRVRWLVVAALAGAVGCYRPDLLEGQYSCTVADPACPNGFACNPCTLLCVLPANVCSARDASSDFNAGPPDLAQDGASHDFAVAADFSTLLDATHLDAFGDLPAVPDLLAPDLTSAPDLVVLADLSACLKPCLTACCGGAEICSPAPLSACCTATGADLPDDNQVDSNCDGVDGDASDAVFVDPVSGNDMTGNGTLLRPKKTVSAALVLAAAATRHQILVATGTDVENATLVLPPAIGGAGYGIYGGYDGTFARSALTAAPILSGPSRAVDISGLTQPVMWDRVDVRAAAATTPGDSTIAMGVTSSAGRLTVARSHLTAGAGAPGAPGTDGVPGNPGIAGGDSTPGAACNCTQNCGLLGCSCNGSSCSANCLPVAGAKAPMCAGAVTSWSGGAGSSCSGGAGSPGSGGLPGVGPTAGCGGGASGCNSSVGGNGTDGTVGGPGAALGTFSAAGYAPSDGTTGSEGVSGAGGGGAGNKAIDCSGGCNASSVPSPSGGSGGCGGLRGQAGKGGGGSFAVFLWDSSPAFSNDVFETGNGGDGGRGGAGSSGGKGGRGGGKGTGGNGGTGGAGGGAGGGGGGPSIGIYKGGNSAPPAPTNAQWSISSGGIGGRGGASGVNGGAQGPSGATGIFAQTR